MATEIIIEILEDEYRIKPIIKHYPELERGIIFIISELKNLDLSQIYTFDLIEGLTPLQYLNNGKDYYDNIEKFGLIFFSIYGHVLSDIEIHELYINNNFSPALIEAFQNSKIATLIVKPDAAIQKPFQKSSNKIQWKKKYLY